MTRLVRAGIGGCAADADKPGYDVPGWYASVAPARIEREVLMTLSNEITAAPGTVTY